MRIVRRPLAQADMDAIWSYVAEWDHAAADRIIDRITQATDRLVDYPRSGRLHPDIGKDWRSVSARPYVIFYQLARDRIEILRVMHGAQDMPKA